MRMMDFITRMGKYKNRSGFNNPSTAEDANETNNNKT